MKRGYLYALVAGLTALGLIGAATAVGSIPLVEDVAVRLGSGTAGIFLNLKNQGLFPDCLIGVEVMGETDGGMIQLQAEIHKSELQNNMMKMVRVDKVCVGPLGEVKMRGAEGEGYHVMVYGDVHSVKLFHIHMKFESGKTLHFHVENTMAGTKSGDEHSNHQH